MDSQLCKASVLLGAAPAAPPGKPARPPAPTDIADPTEYLYLHEALDVIAVHAPIWTMWSLQPGLVKGADRRETSDCGVGPVIVALGEPAGARPGGEQVRYRTCGERCSRRP